MPNTTADSDGELVPVKKSSGLVLISVATALAGVAGYVITWLVPRHIGFADYVVFAVYWSLLFLVVSALSGIQQEVTRGTTPVTGALERRKARAVSFGLVASIVVSLVMIISAPIWVSSAFPEDGWSLVWPLSVGAASYVWVAVLYGTLYGTFRWEPLFWLIVAEAILRLVAIAFLLAADSGVVAIAWAVSLPYAATLLMVWLPLRARKAVRPVLDVGYRMLTLNVAKTIVAATAMGMLVSGFPFLLGLTSQGAPADHLGLIILAATLTRAPLIVVAMAFQSYLIVLFRSVGGGSWKLFAKLQVIVFATAAGLAVAGWWLGPSVFAWLFPGELVPDGGLIAAFVLSSALVGSLCISAPAVLARSRHSVYTAGWLCAAAVTVGCLMLPLDLYPRTVLALILGPIAGLVIHVAYLGRAHFKVSKPAAL